MKRLLVIGLGWLLWTQVQAVEINIPHNDLSLRADLQLAEDKTIKNGVILMLHGTLAHNRMEIMNTLAELLNEEGQNTLAVNLSYGLDRRDSSALDCGIKHHHKHTDAMAEIDTWVKWLKEQGVEKITLLGHSRGGNQIVWYAKEYDGDVIQNVIAIAPSTYTKEQRAENYKKRYDAALNSVYSKAKSLVDEDKGDELLAAGFVYCRNAQVSATSFVDYYQDNQNFHTPALLADMTKSTLVITGSEDTVVNGLPEALEKLETENVKHIDIEDADHFFRDLHADSVVEAILAFKAE